jgi:hypothetical protein
MFFFELNAFSSSIWYTSKIGQEQPSKLTSNKEMQRAGGQWWINESLTT